MESISFFPPNLVIAPEVTLRHSFLLMQTQRALNARRLRASVGAIVVANVRENREPSYAVELEMSGIRKDRWMEQILLVCSKKREIWGNPAGHVEPGESLMWALPREIHEETGLSEDQYSITGIEDMLLDEGDYLTHGSLPRAYVIFRAEVSLRQIEGSALRRRIVGPPSVRPLDLDNPAAIWVPPHEARRLVELNYPKGASHGEIFVYDYLCKSMDLSASLENYREELAKLL
jgi:8-oxo-dGTP pyrophosphatase MutT (NUDIX family)